MIVAIGFVACVVLAVGMVYLLPWLADQSDQL